MGSMISLSIAAVDIDWGKNDGFIDHSVLFQPGDEGMGPYRYVDEDHRPIVIMQPCLRRTLARVLPRLQMLGYSLSRCEESVRTAFTASTVPLDFPVFCKCLWNLPWNAAGPVFEMSEALSEAYLKTTKAPPDTSIALYEFLLDPYVVLRILAENADFDQLVVSWNYADVVEGGWVSADSVRPSGPGWKWLIVTEGSSDTLVLQKAILTLLPDIADFFDFIDMAAGNPFPGVGNIVAFCRGLARIRFDNYMLIVLDNDTAGRAALSAIQALGFSSNVRVTCLPDLEQLRSFKTIGPSGEAVEDINGRASAIECFLDLHGDGGQPKVRWTAYDKNLKTYQGELVEKESYQRQFHQRFGRDPSYDSTKLVQLMEHLLKTCAAQQ